MTAKRCRECGHVDLWQGNDGRCGLNVQGSRVVCRCACVYGDSAVLVRLPDVGGQYLESETDGGAILTPHRDKAARLTLDGARWYERRCPFAVQIEVLR